jgi:hypothetical protein
VSDMGTDTFTGRLDIAPADHTGTLVPTPQLQAGQEHQRNADGASTPLMRCPTTSRRNVRTLASGVGWWRCRVRFGLAWGQSRAEGSRGVDTRSTNSFDRTR